MNESIPEPTPKELSYRQKAFELSQAHEEEMRQRAIEERQPFYGLQINPTVTYHDDAPGREPGENNWVGLGFDIQPHVTVISALLLVLFIAGTLLFQKEADEVFKAALNFVGSTMGWFYILSANIFVFVVFAFAFSHFGKIRIGGPDARPEFSNFAWYAMLISAGMGIGLLFWSVAEPLYHYNSPSPMFGLEGKSTEAAQAAMGVTYFHWGLHPWGIYALVSLALAFFAYNRGLPLTIRSVFYPLLGDKIYGFWGHLIDILSVLATLFGLATSLGLGAGQVAAGFNFLFNWPVEVWFQVVLIAIITGFATLSVMAGLDGGVKRLSELNIYLAASFMLALFLLGPTVYILKSFTQNLGFYLYSLPRMSFWVETFHSLGPNKTNWQAGWTIFYWGWWISWSPFVGMFIARVSKGRTIKEFLLGVLVLPSLLSFFWMSTFGGTAIWLQLTEKANIFGAVEKNVATAMFEMLKSFPFTSLMSLLGAILVISFFVTSSDSGSLVVDHLTSGGKLDSPVPQRVFWAIMEGFIAAVLLLGGGLKALQTATIVAGLPFAIVLCIMCFSLYKGLKEESFHVKELEEMKERGKLFGLETTES